MKMYSSKVFVFVILVSQYFYVHVSGSLQQTAGEFPRNTLHEGLFNFLSGALHNFPTWVLANKLDPFQLTGEFVTIKNISTNITLTVTNLYINGLSGVNRVFNSAVSVGLDARSFEVSYATNNKILLGGDYEATGLYQGNLRLSSKGQFVIICGEFWQGISFDNLTISESDTFIHLYSANSSYSSVPIFANVSFTNIGFDENQNEELIEAINTELGAMYYSFITRKVVSSNSSIAIPSSRLFIRYINTIFWKTKITDILNWSPISNWDAVNHSTKFRQNIFIVIFMLLLTTIFITG